MYDDIDYSDKNRRSFRRTASNDEISIKERGQPFSFNRRKAGTRIKSVIVDRDSRSMTVAFRYLYLVMDLPKPFGGMIRKKYDMGRIDVHGDSKVMKRAIRTLRSEGYNVPLDIQIQGKLVTHR